MLAKLGAPTDAIRRQVEAELGRVPKVRGGSGQYLGQRLQQVFDRAVT